MTVSPRIGAAPPLWRRLPEGHLVLLMAPLGAVGVGVADLLASRGFATPALALGWALVQVFYLAQAVITVRTPRWADTWWAVAVTCVSCLSSPLFSAFLVAPRPVMSWFWLIGCVIMLAAYLCPPWRALAAAVVCSAIGLWFSAHDGLDPWRSPTAVALGLITNGLPGLAASLVLGRIRRRERTVLEQTRLDPVTKVLNRRGLEHEILQWQLRLRTDLPVSVVSIHLDGFEEAVAAWGAAVGDQLLARVGGSLSRAYQRSHLVSRFVDHEFVVVSDIDPDLLVPSLQRAVRVASPQRPLTASAGVVSGIPLRLLAAGQLVPMLERARQLVTRAQVHASGVVREELDADAYVPVGSPAPVTTSTVQPDGSRPVFWPEAEGRVLGWWLASTGILLSAVPRVDGLPRPLGVTAYLACLVLAVGGMWLVQHPGPALPLARALVALAVPTAAGVLTSAASSGVRSTVLLLAMYPAAMAGMVLGRVCAVLAVLLLPPGLWVATALGPHPVPHALSVSVSAVLFAGGTALVANLIRSASGRALDQLHGLTRTDPTTGVLTRDGLAREFLDLPPTERAGVLLVSVQPREGVGQATTLETDLVTIAGVLHELGRGRGHVGRVGGRDLALVVTNAERLALLRRHLDADLADAAPDVRVVVGLAHADQHSERGLWAALAEADAQVRAQRTGLPGGAHLVPADPGPDVERPAAARR